MRSFLGLPADTGFGLHNLPYGVFSRQDGGSPSVCVRIGNHVLDLHRLDEAGLLDLPELEGQSPFVSASLNGLMALGQPAWHALRAHLQRLLRADGDPALRDNADLMERVLVPLAEVTMRLPVEIGDYTDFYSSRQHATNVGAMFRDPANALLPNWLHLPVGYHGRASSVVVSGTPVRRPRGQTQPGEGQPPAFGPTRMLDFELELGVLVGPGNALGEGIPIERAREHIFGYVLVNDWSARDMQRWEYVPLGPFLAKNFLTSISPWVVPAEALDPFRVAGEPQTPEAGNPEPLPYLRQAEPRALDIALEVRLESEAMRASGTAGAVICRTNARHLYWSPEQQLAHHTSNGCNVRPGDMLASGTISGPTPDEYGSLLELAWRGERPLALPDGTARRALEDGDRLVMTGWAQGEGYRVGFGEVEGVVLPAHG